MARIVSFLVLLAILVVIAIFFFRVMAGFFVPLFLAALLGVIVQPLNQWMLDKCGGYRYAAATLTTLLVAVIGLLPLAIVVTTATLEGASLIDRMQVRDVRTRLDELRQNFGLQIPLERDVRRIEATLKHWRGVERTGQTLDFDPAAVQNLIDRVQQIRAWHVAEQENAPEVDIDALQDALERLRDSPPESRERDVALAEAVAQFRVFKRDLLGGTYSSWLAEAANPTDEQIEQVRRQLLSTAGPILSLGGDTLAFIGKVLIGVLIMMAALFFLLAEGSKMLDALVRISPLEEHYVRELVREFDRACRAIVLATLLSAIAQGLLAGIGFHFAGLQASVFLLVLLTMILALVPMAGTALVWIPVCLYLYFYEGRLGAAAGLAAYCAVVVSGIDNLIKPAVLHGQSNLHPLLALLSILGGLQALGPIGILVGPMVVVFLQVMLKLVQREMSSLDRGALSLWPAGFAMAGARVPTPTAAADEPAADAPAASTTGPAAGGGNGRTAAPPAKKPQETGKKRRR
jgi:predicted PurR-regulated permease PerM